MKIGTKLFLGFGSIAVLFIILNVTSNNSLSEINENVHDLTFDKYQKGVWLNNIIDIIAAESDGLKNAVLTDDIDDKQEYIAKVLSMNNVVSENLDSLNRTILAPEAIELLRKIDDNRENYLTSRDGVIENTTNNNIEAIRILNTDYEKYKNKYISILNDLIDFQHTLFIKTANDSDGIYKRASNVQIIFAIVALILTFILGYVMSRIITKPLAKAVLAADLISNGNFTVDLENTSKDETGQLLNAMKTMCSTISNLTMELNQLSEAATLGKLDTRADYNKFQGEYQHIIRGFNNTLDAVIGPLNVTAEYVDRISKGDIPPKITDHYNGDFNEIKNNLNQCIDAITLLVDDTKMLTQAAKEGRLDTRANASELNGDFREIVIGFNDTLDAVIGPLNVTAEYVDRISKGDIPPKITDHYNGDFNEIKINLNQCIDAVGFLVSDMTMLTNNYSDGNLNYRIETSHHQGDYKKIMDGINDTLDSVVGPLKAISGYFERIANGDIPAIITEEYKGDFLEIKLSINKGIHAINLLVSDVEYIAKENSEGNIDVRINLDNHFGDFRKIMGAVNGSLDAVVLPLKMITDIFDRISNGDIPERTTDNYGGFFEILKNIVNKCIDAINLLVEDATLLSKAATEGELGTRADATKHGGDFRKIVEGVNETLDVIVNPVGEISSIMSIFSTGDLSARILTHYNGDFAALTSDINNFVDNLSSLIRNITSAVQNTSSAAVNISLAAESLATASQEQAAQADDVANAVEAMTRTITENAMSASRTAEVATHNSHIASESGKVVEQTVEKMRDIAEVVRNSAENIEQLGESSKQIGEIISVIDDIADQTNLLALNAAIEAARAGEQGRGFAVVADEVRKLAERTTDATKQIANMIKGIQNETEQAVIAMHKGTSEVQSGIDLADKAGDSLKQILNSTQEVLDMVNQIASASEEQSATSEQISKNVIAISKVTTESSKNVENVADISDELTQMTEALKLLVLTFKVEGETNYSNSAKYLGTNGGKQLNPAGY